MKMNMSLIYVTYTPLLYVGKKYRYWWQIGNVTKIRIFHSVRFMLGQLKGQIVFNDDDELGVMDFFLKNLTF